MKTNAFPSHPDQSIKSSVVPLKVENVSKTFTQRSFFWQNNTPPFAALDRISFELGQGEILGLLGPNGAGKTTLIQMLLGTMTPSSGSITYFGKDFFLKRSEIMKRVSFASTYVRMPGRLSVYENLDFYAKLYEISPQDRQTRIEHYLKFFDLWRLKDRKAAALSAGEMTRAILAKAFLSNPDVVLLDEPTASLDPDIAHEVRSFIVEQRKKRNVSMLYTSHNMDEVAQICDRVIVLRKGVMIADDTPSNLAACISKARVHLRFEQNREDARQFIISQGYPCKIEGETLTIDADGDKIADLLISLTQNNFAYNHIAIQKPTLEDYFLSIAQRGKE